MVFFNSSEKFSSLYSFCVKTDIYMHLNVINLDTSRKKSNSSKLIFILYVLNVIILATKWVQVKVFLKYCLSNIFMV